MDCSDAVAASDQDPPHPSGERFVIEIPFRVPALALGEPAAVVDAVDAAVAVVAAVSALPRYPFRVGSSQIRKVVLNRNTGQSTDPQETLMKRLQVVLLIEKTAGNLLLSSDIPLRTSLCSGSH